MQKKNLNKILIGLLILIWGILIFKYVSPYFKSPKNQLAIEVIAPSEKYNLFTRDTFQLKAIKRDPFLGTYKVKKEKTKSIQPTRKTIKVKKNIVWPKISYLGYVKSNTNKSKLGLVRINNKLHKVRKSQTIDQIQVVKILKDSIAMKLNGSLEYFNR